MSVALPENLSSLNAYSSNIYTVLENEHYENVLLYCFVKGTFNILENELLN